MLKLLLLPLLLSPVFGSYTPPLRIHQADLFRLKCDSLPYRSKVEQSICIFAINDQVEYSQGDGACADVLRGSAMMVDNGFERYLHEMYLNPSAYHNSESSGGRRSVLCKYDPSDSCKEGTLALPGRCVLRSERPVTWSEAVTFCEESGAGSIVIHNHEENIVFSGILDGNESGWLLPYQGKERKWSSDDQTIDYWNWFFAGKSGDEIEGLKCGEDQHAVLSRKSKSECAEYGYWKVDSSANKNIALCERKADCDMCIGGGEEPGSGEISTESPPSTLIPTVTATPTCSGPENDPPHQNMLWPLKYYYNAWRILHAFSATPAGYKKIMNNGIGYQTKADSGTLGMSISDEGYARLKEVCNNPEQLKNIRQMWFGKSGVAYHHSWTPKEVYVGYVSVASGACGATLPLKKWGCVMSADMMYAANLKGNTWYSGRVQNKGAVHFWLWSPSEAARNQMRKGGTSCGGLATTAAPVQNVNQPPPAGWMLNLKYYYNYGRILHAFAADTAGYNAIMRNGIGYSTSAGSGSLGRSLQLDKIEDLKKICVNASKLQKLYFNRSGNAYVHAFGSGTIFAGWVAVEYNDCGATKGMMKYTCLMSADIMYAANLEHNTWYRGRRQNGGKKHFYLW